MFSSKKKKKKRQKRKIGTLGSHSWIIQPAIRLTNLIPGGWLLVVRGSSANGKLK